MSGKARAVLAFERDLAKRLLGARRLAVVGVGDDAKPRDRLGMDAARSVEALGLEGVSVFLAGVAPEAYTGPVRRSKPDCILVLDAADWGAEAGALSLLPPESIRATSASTHNLPLSVVVEYLETVVKIKTLVVGLQSDLHSKAKAPTAAERRAVKRLAAAVARAVAARPSGAKGSAPPQA